ncbi:MAG: hypothetical protein EHM27_04940 [Deltaproteobacteria bacterium]|nr:MAG: hypothetical protein EHM27_14820 [Deltaproteobacteria bacterium]RPJ41873.1 MAG: hypothetical protein EHM27_04940 [Deltaproteobacteria bacterium]
MRSDLTLVTRRAVFFSLLAWLPLLVLSTIEGAALGQVVTIPFLYDFPVSVRLLIALPLLILAERVIDARTMESVRHFARSGLVEEKNFREFRSMVRQTLRMRDSFLAEGIMVAVVIFGTAFLRLELSGSSSTWQILVFPSGATRTMAGWWHVFVSLPIFQFLMVRWLWRYLIWCWLLWRISRLDLQLIPTHPDRAAGLGFLGVAQAKFGILVLAFSSLLSSHWGAEILLRGVSLYDYKMMILGYVVLVLFVLLAPLLVFSSRLFEVKRRGLLEYGALANRYTWTFDRKWIRGEAPEGEALIGSADIQSLADLGNSFQIIQEMRPVPIDLWTTIVPMAAFTVAPFLPLALTVFPFDEIVKKIIGILL